MVCQEAGKGRKHWVLGILRKKIRPFTLPQMYGNRPSAPPLGAANEGISFSTNERKVVPMKTIEGHRRICYPMAFREKNAINLGRAFPSIAGGGSKGLYSVGVVRSTSRPL